MQVMHMCLWMWEVCLCVHICACACACPECVNEQLCAAPRADRESCNLNRYWGVVWHTLSIFLNFSYSQVSMEPLVNAGLWAGLWDPRGE